MSALPLQSKVRFLSSYVLPNLLYAAECSNHRQKQYKEMAIFRNICRRRLLGVRRTGQGQKKIRLDLLRRRCRLLRHLAFMARVLGRPFSLLARMMFFAKVVPGQGQARGVGVG